MSEAISADLADRLSARWGEQATIDGLTLLTGGASMETWGFDAVTGDARHRLILRRERRRTGGSDLAREAAAMTAAAAAGVPVPGLIDVAPDSMVLERIDGETIPRRLLRDPRYADARAKLATEVGAILGRLHSMSAGAIEGLDRLDDPVCRLRAQYQDYRSPALELGLRWLRDHPVPAAPATVVHGDLRLGNMIIGPDGVRAVLDWERVHRGDPVEDLGWLCAKVWRFGGAEPVAGVGRRDDLLDAYSAVAGWRPSMDQLHWWELYATVQWGLMCGMQAQRHLSGEEPSVELAVIGRRRCEQEYDVLLALGLAEVEQVTDVLELPGDTTTDLYGRSSAAELLDAVRGFLADEATGRSFHALVASNALRIVQRELLLGPADVAAHQERLRTLGCVDDDQLCTAIEDGSLDHRWDEVVATLRASTREQLLVANPRHLAKPA